MYYFLSVDKDTTLSYTDPTSNYGLDEILELRKMWYGGSLDISRILIKFKIDLLESYLVKYNMAVNEAILLLSESSSSNIGTEYTITAHPVYGDWDMGTGTLITDDDNSNGACWVYRNQLNQYWNSGSSFPTEVTGSFNGYGGTYYVVDEANQSFNYITHNINMDVTDMVIGWLSGSYDNNGMLLKFENSYESDDNDYGILKFYSRETNTIYSPKLRIGINDSQFNTGSLNQITDDNVKLIISNFKKEYRGNTLYRFNIIVKPQYFVKSFNDTVSNLCLTENSYYQIRDYLTDNIVIPYSEFSKISCNPNGNYFDIDFSNWEPNRYYGIEFKFNIDGMDYFIDEDYTFKLIQY